MKTYLYSIFFIFFISLSSCHIMLIGPYDENVDKGIQALAKEVSTLHARINRHIDNQQSYAFIYFEENYNEIEGEIEALKIRIKILPKYKIVADQIDLLNSSITLLEKDHQSGFANANQAGDKIKKAINIDFDLIEDSISKMLSLQEGLKRSK